MRSEIFSENGHVHYKVSAINGSALSSTTLERGNHPCIVVAFFQEIFASYGWAGLFEDGWNNRMNDKAGKEVALFTEALKVPARDRAAFLKTACRGDNDLRRKIEALLKAYDHVGNFLEEPPSSDADGNGR